jgi:hypothetical protein
MQKIFNTLTVLMAVYLVLNFNPPILGGVRTTTTGFQVISGDNISIGTPTPTANFHIYETATTSIAIDGGTLGCLRLLDTDGAGYTNITALNGVVGTSTDADCGF